MHYQLHGTEGIQEWDALEVVGLGSVTFGTDYRTFYVPMYHQFHCLRTFRKALDNGSKYQGSEQHMNHCFNYFRQWTMCNADLTLEPGDFMKRNFTRERTGMTHVCKAWDKVYLQTAMKWVQWAKYWSGSYSAARRIVPPRISGALLYSLGRSVIMFEGRANVIVVNKQIDSRKAKFQPVRCSIMIVHFLDVSLSAISKCVPGFSRFKMMMIASSIPCL